MSTRIRERRSEESKNERQVRLADLNIPSYERRHNVQPEYNSHIQQFPANSI